MTGKILEEILASSENTAEIQSLFCSSWVLAEGDSREMIISPEGSFLTALISFWQDIFFYFYFYLILTLVVALQPCRSSS